MRRTFGARESQVRLAARALAITARLSDTTPGFVYLIGNHAMLRLLRGPLLALIATVWACIETPHTAAAGGELDVAAWLRKPNVRLVVVEFYADWCAPCKAAVPKWKALHDKYRSDGLRLIVVSVGESGVCTNPGWDPDDTVCDVDGRISDRFGDAAAKLPQAFLYSWQGNRLASGALVEQVETAVERYFRETPRILVEEGRDGEGKPLTDGASVRAMAQAELVHSGKFTVVANDAERAKLADARRKALQDPGYSDKAACELGEEVSPNSILTPKVIRAGGSETVVVELYSIEKSCMIATERAKVSASGISGAVTEAVSGLVAKLTGSRMNELPGAIALSKVPAFGRGFDDYGQKIQNPIVDKKGYLAVESEPAGATVIVNGREEGNTPFVKEIMAGEYVVTVQAGALWNPDRQRIKLGTEGARLNFKLAPNYGVLTVESTPPGAAILLNGEPTGHATPYTFPARKAGSYTVELKLENYLSRSTSVFLADGQPSVVREQLEPNFGTLRLVTDPPGASITVNGKAVEGRTPLDLPNVPAGSHEVVLQLASHNEYRKRVSVERGQVSTLEAPLVPQLGLIKVEAFEGTGADRRPVVGAKVFLDGRVVGETPFKKQVLAGQYQVTAENPRGAGGARVAVVEGAEVRTELLLDPDGFGRVRAAPVALVVSGSLAFLGGLGAHVYNLTFSGGEGQPSAVAAVSCYAIGGVLLLAGIVDGAINGWRERSAPGEVRLPTAPGGQDWNKFFNSAPGEVRLLTAPGSNVKLSLSGAIENGAALKGVW
jgi:thiol-disulfide isomerase/thioredoxin